MKICRLYFEIFLYYAQIEYNKQGRLKTGLRYRKTDPLRSDKPLWFIVD
ncbi:cold-shock protein [Neisseria meningitidis]|nr:cold-shock protein [Neisseria meningitidis]ARC12223.2 cold-shock protein [Neisseria meningitidis]MBG8578685.1 cold-shock protein [Neisseria meningitidis]MBG8583627.1 cold-shock protein [Neisseria meningitidis]MBG8594185.1 cold-shock protein [Neisseria meningitidis]